MIIKACQKWGPSIVIILLTSFPALTTGVYKCETDSNYSTNSTYGYNLNTLLSSLPTHVDISGFYSATAGDVPDSANVVVLCRGDLHLETCQACIRNATADILTFCPNTKRAIFWRELCMIRYSDKPILSVPATKPAFWVSNWENATSVELFKVDVGKLLDDLREEAALGGHRVKVAAGSKEAPDYQRIYALVQCTPDLSPEDCRSCLRGAAEDLRRCCDWKRSAAIYWPSCNLRYGTSQFYNPIMFRESLLPSPAGQDGNNSTKIAIIIVIPIVGCLILAVCLFIFLRGRIKQKSKQNLEMHTLESLQYDFATIRGATNGFSEANKLGEGGFGAVYKGELLNGHEIAVKRLFTRSGQGDMEFKNEVLLLARLQHRNLVRLLGFCLQETERILVYEFVQNASLDHFVFDPIKRQEMDWDLRYKIIRGIAKGLVYLHEDSRLKIIHRDLKASNVLLDGDMNPKIADFGLARLVVQEKTHDTTSRIAGTYGYMPPEYAIQGRFSIKSDVFSFGVMVLEIISGQKNNNFQDEYQNVQHMLSYAWRNQNEENVIDPVLRNTSGFRDDIFRCIHIALLCVQETPGNRPTMASVVQMLNNSYLTLSMPTKPGFFIQGRLDGDYTENSTAEPHSESDPSRNIVSMTEMYPR